MERCVIEQRNDGGICGTEYGTGSGEERGIGLPLSDLPHSNHRSEPRKEDECKGCEYILLREVG